MNKTRVITAVVMSVVLIPFIFLGGYFTYFMAAILSFIGSYELVKMHNDKCSLPKTLNLVVPFASLCLMLVVVLGKITNISNIINYFAFCLLLLITLFLCLPLFYKELKMTDGFYYIASLFYGGISFVIIASIRNAEIISEKNLILGNYDINLPALLVFCYPLACSMFTDIFAYEIGRRYGKHKLIPDVSPNKSIEGSIGGSIMGTIIGSLILILSENFLGFNLFNIKNEFLHILLIIIFSLLLTIVSQIGDLIASKLKREYGIKDYGKIFPGHGGVMDRFDSLILTSIVFFIVLAIFGVVLC